MQVQATLSIRFQ